MRANVSISDAAAYDRDGRLPDKSSEAKSIYPVIHRSVDAYKRGTDDLALRLGIPVNSLRQKLNVNNDTHNFHPAQLMLLMRELDDVTILKHMAQFLGYVVHPDRRIFDGDLLDALAEFQMAVGELVVHAARLQREKASGEKLYATSNDVNRGHFHAQEVHHALQGVQRALDAFRRPAPETPA